MDERFKIGKFWRAVFGAILLLGLYATVVRFTKGLGASTHLSDEFPWGLWIGFDILVGVGLAAGGFVIAATVHIFHIKRFAPISRPAILTAFLGYLLVIVALLFDLGRPYRIWHPMVMGNPHSVMFEVAMCVMLYTLVLALEFSPLLFTRLKWQKPVKFVRAIYIPLVIVGVLLSTLHQSSLGTMYVIVPDKLHGLWYSPLLPAFFFLSAVAGGLAMTIFESFMSARAFGKRLEQDLLEGIARVIVVILAVLLVWKIQNLWERGSLGLVFHLSPESVMFWGEMLLGVALPMFLFMSHRMRTSTSGLFFGAMCTIMGFIINRLNVAITGLVGSAGVNYVPSWMEFTVTMMIVAIGLALFRYAAKNLSVFPDEKEPAHALAPPLRPALQGRALVALWSFLVVGFLLVVFTSRWQDGRAVAAQSSASDTEAVVSFNAPRPLNLIDDLRLPRGEDSPGQVLFNHSSHVDSRNPSCASCHEGTFSILGGPHRNAGADFHEAPYCGRCHDGEAAFAWDDDCEYCHAGD